MSKNGKILYETTYNNTYANAEEFATRVRADYGRYTAVCESTGNMWTKTYYAMQDSNIPIVLANPFKIPLISKSAIKTDKIDARALATLLRLNAIPVCHVQSKENREIIAMLRHRTTIVQDRTRVTNRLYSLLDRHDLDMREVKSRNVKGPTFLDWLEKQQLGKDTAILKQYTSQIRRLNDDEKAANMRIAEEARNDDNAKLIMSISGFDYFGALLISAEIEDIRRFAAPNKLVSWTGLCPRIYQSGAATRHGRMKKDSNRRVNWMVIQGARVAVRYDVRMKKYYESVCKRHVPAIAITHVANKIVTIIWHMLTNQVPYEQANKDLYERKLKYINAI